jgi:hypothetical protein
MANETNIDRPSLENLDWFQPKREESLNRVYDHATGLADESERWYLSHRRSKRRWGQGLRAAALVLGTAAAVIPILSQILTEPNAEPAIEPGWASIALVIAAGLVALDRYFGYSSAWMRYMTTGMRIARLRQEFEYDWNHTATTVVKPPSDADLETLLRIARKLVTDVNDAVAAETGDWVSEFRGTLQTAETNMQPQSATSHQQHLAQP